jgi:hypothetical protein
MDYSELDAATNRIRTASLRNRGKTSQGITNNTLGGLGNGTNDIVDPMLFGFDYATNHISPFTPGANVDSLPNSILYVRATKGGTISKIGFTFSGGASNLGSGTYVQAGIYTNNAEHRDAAPGKLVAKTNRLQVTLAHITAGYKELTLTDPIEITEGDWFAFYYTRDNTASRANILGLNATQFNHIAPYKGFLAYEAYTGSTLPTSATPLPIGGSTMTGVSVPILYGLP